MVPEGFCMHYNAYNRSVLYSSVYVAVDPFIPSFLPSASIFFPLSSSHASPRMNNFAIHAGSLSSYDSPRSNITLGGARRAASMAYTEWEEISCNKTSKVVSFVRDDERINVYYTTSTVSTVLNHLQRGRKQLFRANVPTVLLRSLFENLRAHTVLGYFDLKGKHRVLRTSQYGFFDSSSDDDDISMSDVSLNDAAPAEYEAFEKTMTLRLK